ncbi:MAG: hypothetical protein ABIW33_06360 [Sphingomicrobium sp.]
MHRHSALALTLLLSACAGQQQTSPPPSTPAPVAPAPGVTQSGLLIGKSSAELIARFGTPALRIQEGSGLKLQFRGSECVLDAYLYPSGGTMRVTYVDARYSSGVDYNQAACIVALSDPNRLNPN